MTELNAFVVLFFFSGKTLFKNGNCFGKNMVKLLEEHDCKCKLRQKDKKQDVRNVFTPVAIQKSPSFPIYALSESKPSVLKKRILLFIGCFLSRARKKTFNEMPKEPAGDRVKI